MDAVPSDIQAIGAEQRLHVAWSDDHQSDYGYVHLRGECQCAGCVDEITGRRLLDVASIPCDIQIEDMQLVGNYAIRIRWSDGHDTGLFTWPMLRERCMCAYCRG